MFNPIMKIQKFVSIFCILIALLGCNVTKKTNIKRVELPEVTIKPTPAPNSTYRASNSILQDLKNTKLEISFDWEKQYLFGKATLTLQPHFYDQNILWLNARGMEIKEVKLLFGKDSIPLIFGYANDSLKITLNKTYNRREQFQIYISYVAKPEELIEIGGSSAINSNKGLYFINPLNEERNKPMQIWTQGETQSNSVWFPTIDSPNQKMTQEISITIDSSFSTLSNGLLINSDKHSDGTRTDTWKQVIPHAPYLAMFVVGKFAIVKDHWRTKEVSYYVEPEYKNVASRIFGKTPEMMEFFSTKLRFDFPWEKYNQVVVRDYVSGAMENSSVTLFGEFMQKDERQLLEEDYEEYIAHELFHQWFGDVVTCESWSNVTLNEGFATYGEYLWNENKYGRDYADIYLKKKINAYLRESKGKQEDLIRFTYNESEDMFDKHTYDKGSCILNMLRKYAGDDAFFTSLNNYLEENKFKSVEAHNLRLVFEKTTGEDLNWFFNQWYFNKGHPDLDISYSWNETDKEAIITILQQQNLKTNPIYKLPVDVDIYENNKVRRERIIIDSKKNTFHLKCEIKPELINFDAEKMLLATKIDHHSDQEWIKMYYSAPLFLDRFEAIQHFGKDVKPETAEAGILKLALTDKNWKIRNVALHNIDSLLKSNDSSQIKSLLVGIINDDKKSSNRSYALDKLTSNFTGKEFDSILKVKLTDSSFDVIETAIQILMGKDSVLGLKYIKELEKENNTSMMDIVANVYTTYGGDDQLNYMNQTFAINKSSNGRYARIQNYSKYLMRCTDQKGIEDGLQLLQIEGKVAEPWHNRYAVAQLFTYLKNNFLELKKTAELANNTTLIFKYSTLQILAENYLDDLKKSETNEKMKKLLNIK